MHQDSIAQMNIMQDVTFCTIHAMFSSVVCAAFTKLALCMPISNQGTFYGQHKMAA